MLIGEVWKSAKSALPKGKHCPVDDGKILDLMELVEQAVFAKNNFLFFTEAAFVNFFKPETCVRQHVCEVCNCVTDRRDFKQVAGCFEAAPPAVRTRIGMQIRNDERAERPEDACSFGCEFTKILRIREKKGCEHAIGGAGRQRRRRAVCVNQCG